MKTDKKKTVSKKFDLEKMKVAKLDDLSSINGGYGIGGDGDIKTTTNTVQKTIVTD